MKLIDADALDAEMYHKSFEVDDGRNVWNSGLWIRYKIFEEAIRDAPTVDAVPIIRCRECRWGRDACGNIECHVDLNIPSEYHGYDWYCSNGERKEE